LKGFTANQAKKALGLRDGALWQNENYDHLVRSEEENPVRAGLAEKPEEFRWSSAGAAWKGG
jgi:hypothetical protein